MVERDRKHYADVKCEKHRFPRTLPMIFDRLSRHLGFSNLARLISRVSNLDLLTDLKNMADRQEWKGLRNQRFRKIYVRKITQHEEKFF